MLRTFLILLLTLCSGSVGALTTADLPPVAQGTFVQRKVLADVNVTLVSKGTFRFTRGEAFVWETREPVASTFYATPTNYAFTVAGRTSVHPLEVDVSDIGKIFSIKEMRTYVKSVTTQPEHGFPTRVDVDFVNGDRLEIEMTRLP